MQIAKNYGIDLGAVASPADPEIRRKAAAALATSIAVISK
jgi:hypothetical protein